MCNLNVTVVLEFISSDLYLLFAIRFSSKFQNSVFYQHMRPKSGLKFPRPLVCSLYMKIKRTRIFLSGKFKGLGANSVRVTVYFPFYAPNFEKVGRAYCFRLVCLSVYVSVCVLTFEW